MKFFGEVQCIVVPVDIDVIIWFHNLMAAYEKDYYNFNVYFLEETM